MCLWPVPKRKHNEDQAHDYKKPSQFQWHEVKSGQGTLKLQHGWFFCIPFLSFALYITTKFCFWIMRSFQEKIACNQTASNVDHVKQNNLGLNGESISSRYVLFGFVVHLACYVAWVFDCTAINELEWQEEEGVRGAWFQQVIQSMTAQNGAGFSLLVSTCPRFWKCPGNEEKMARQVEEPALLEVSFRLWSSLHSWQQAGVWNNQDWMDKTLNAVNKIEKSWQEQKIFDLEFIENNRDAHHCRKWSLTQGVMDLWLNSETP